MTPTMNRSKVVIGVLALITTLFLTTAMAPTFLAEEDDGVLHFNDGSSYRVKTIKNNQTIYWAFEGLVDNMTEFGHHTDELTVRNTNSSFGDTYSRTFSLSPESGPLYSTVYYLATDNIVWEANLQDDISQEVDVTVKELKTDHDYYWYKDGSYQKEVTSDSTGGVDITINDVDGSATYSLMDTEGLKSWYSIEAWDGSVAAIPDISVSTEEATQVDQDSATLEGDIELENDQQDADVWFYWREEGVDTWNETEKQTVTGDSDFSHNLTGLDKNETYEFYATGELIDTGDTDDGSINSFTTLDLGEYGIVGRWEENNELIPDNFVEENIEITFHFEDRTEIFNPEENPTKENLPANPIRITYRVSDSYTRSRLSDLEDTDTFTYWVSKKYDQTGEYALTLKDWTGNYGPPTGEIWIWKYHEGDLMKIDERKWTGDATAYPVLKRGDTYRYAVHNNETEDTIHFSPDVFPQSLEKTINVEVEEVDNYEQPLEGVTYGAIRQDENTLKLEYTDEHGETDNVEIQVVETEDNVVIKEETIYSNNFSWLYDSLEKGKNYVVRLDINRTEDSASVSTSIPFLLDPDPAAYPEDFIEDYVKGDYAIPIFSVIGVFFVFIVASFFHKHNPELAMLAIAFTVTALSMTAIWINKDLLPFGMGVIIFFWAMAIIRNVGEGI